MVDRKRDRKSEGDIHREKGWREKRRERIQGKGKKKKKKGKRRDRATQNHRSYVFTMSDSQSSPSKK